MTSLLKPGKLAQALLDRTESAIASGALQTIETEHHRLEQNGIPFVVRVASNLERKVREKRKHERQAQPTDPFLPPEPALTLGEIGDSHLAVLNKFNVVEHHLLIVTRHFEDQQRLLTRADFTALWQCLQAYPSLAFYNGGVMAGASQPHKHLQLVPLPLYPGNTAFPFAPLFAAAAQGEGISRLPFLPFEHAWCRLPHDIGFNAEAAVDAIHRRYRQLLEQAGITPHSAADGERQSAPYNFLMTEAWMLLVPRSRECSEGVSVNGLGYVGSLFVPDQRGLDAIRKLGPMNLLAAVSGKLDTASDAGGPLA
jgi:sulfate adenylyltransferase (ADP) / ATP adenylyltransferase